MQMPREWYIPAGATKVADKHSDAIAYLYTSRSGKPAARGFCGKRRKPDYAYTFRNEAERAARVRAHFEGRQETLNRKRQRRADAKAERANSTLPRIGSVFVYSWGYEQTNIDAFEVVSHHGTSTVGLREISTMSTGERPYDGWAGSVRPRPGHYISDTVFRKRVQNGMIRMAHGSANLWDHERGYYCSSYA
jgi:hypothetical protein